MSPDTTIRRTAPQMRTAGLVAAGASTMSNRTNTLVNGYSYGWGNRTSSKFHHDKDNVNGTASIREPASHMFHHDNVNDGEAWSKNHNDNVNDNDSVNDNVNDIRTESIGIEHLNEDKTKCVI